MIGRERGGRTERERGRKKAGRETNTNPLCVGDIRLGYLKRLYTVSATTHQIAILLAFNIEDKHSFRYIYTLYIVPVHVHCI